MNKRSYLLFGSLYICLCIIRSEEIHRLSAFLRTPFADLSWSLISQYYGSLLCNGALVCVVGACMSIREQRNSFNCSAEWFDLEAMYVEISWLNLSLFIELRWRVRDAHIKTAEQRKMI